MRTDSQVVARLMLVKRLNQIRLCFDCLCFRECKDKAGKPCLKFEPKNAEDESCNGR